MQVYIHIYIYICILCFCSHLVTDLHVWANLEPEIWEVLSVCSKILENWGSKCKSVAIVIQFQTHSISGLAFQCSYIIIHVHTCSYIIYEICSKNMKNDCQWFGYSGAQRTSKVGLLLVICGGIWWTVNQSIARYEKRHGLADKHVQTNSPSSSSSSSSWSWWWWLWLWLWLLLLLLRWWSLSREYSVRKIIGLAEAETIEVQTHWRSGLLNSCRLTLRIHLEQSVCDHLKIWWWLVIICSLGQNPLQCVRSILRHEEAAPEAEPKTT